MSMHTHVVYEIRCDHPGCDDAWVGGAGTPAHVVVGAASSRGWDAAEPCNCGYHGHHDHCPEHAAGTPT